MDQQKKELIVKEIKYWKEHQLLPSHYCDFLLALYTEGEAEESVNKKNHKRTHFSLKTILFYFLVYIIGSLFPISFLIIYFTELVLVLQMLFFTFFIILTCIVTFIWYRKDKVIFHLPLITGALILFLVSIHFIGTLTTGNLILLIVLTMNCLLWVLIGRKLHVTYLLYAGIIGVIIVFLFYFLY